MALRKPHARQVAIVLGSLAFFATWFVLFCYWTFPYERLGEFLVLQVESPVGPDGRRHPSGRSLEIIDVDPSWLTGIELTGVHLTLPATEPDGAPIDVVADEATVRVKLLSLLLGDLAGSLSVDVGGGHIDADVSIDGGLGAMGDPAAFEAAAKDIELAFEEVDMRPLGVVRSLAGVPLEGVLDGTVDLSLGEDLAQTTGAVDLTVRGMRVGNGTAKLAIPGMGDGITLDTIDVGDLTIRMDVADGVAQVRTFESNGADAKLEGSGDIRIARELDRSRVNLLVKVKFEDAYRQRSPRTRALFSLLEVQPQLRAASTPDGAVQFRISGAPDRTLRFEPAGRAGGGGSARRSTGGRRARPRPPTPPAPAAPSDDE